MMGQTAMRSRRAVLVLSAVLAAMVLSSGVALAANITCQVNVYCLGTNKADTLKGTAERDYINGRGSADVLKGLGTGDRLFGKGGADGLFGGDGPDFLVGGVGNDELDGGGGANGYFFGPDWGKDSITDDTPTGNKLYFYENGSGVVTDSLTINLSAGAGPQVKNASATNTIDWEGNVISGLVSGKGSDHITGNLQANVIHDNYASPSDFDNISTGVGNDVINVDDGPGADTVNCGESLIFLPTDNDTVYYDASDTVTNCETRYKDGVLQP